MISRKDQMMQTLLVVKGIHAFKGGNVGPMKATTYFSTLETTQCQLTFGHRNRKKTSGPFNRSAAFVKKRYASSIYNIYNRTQSRYRSCNSLKPVRQVYEEIVNSDRGRPNHCIITPRKYKQVFSQSL